MNPYNFLFYIIYKFIKLTTPQNLKQVVPDSASNLFLICLINNLLAILILINPFQFIEYKFSIFAFIFIGVIAFLYFFNKKTFIDNTRYKELEQLYDVKLNLKKPHIIVMAILYIILSIGVMIWAGINLK
jgi:uncharacterized membrane protein